MKMINKTFYLIFISTIVVLFNGITVNAAATADAAEETRNLLRKRNTGCPQGFGFNYASREPFCKINYKCAVAQKEFSTQCGCGCQPIKCKDDTGCPQNTHHCVKGACFRKGYPKK